MKAWHFVGDTLRDGSPVPADGVTLRFDGEPILCKQGFHWSRDPFDALLYAPGPILCLVEVGGTIIEDSDKGVSTERTIIARMDASDMLRYFARMQALSVIHLVKNPPDVVLNYLMTGDESLQNSARDSAWDAAWDAAWGASLDSAQASAWDSARAAAWGAGNAAAGHSKALNAARAARTAAWAASRSDFNTLVNECFSDFL